MMKGILEKIKAGLDRSHDGGDGVRFGMERCCGG